MCCQQGNGVKNSEGGANSICKSFSECRNRVGNQCASRLMDTASACEPNVMAWLSQQTGLVPEILAQENRPKDENEEKESVPAYLLQLRQIRQSDSAQWIKPSQQEMPTETAPPLPPYLAKLREISKSDSSLWLFGSSGEVSRKPISIADSTAGLKRR